MSAAMAGIGLVALLLVGAWLAAALDHGIAAVTAGRPPATALLAPLRNAAADLVRQTTATERPDALNWWLAPALYLGLAAVGLSVVPLAEDVVVLDTSVGIVVWGACEALTVVVVFLHGWSPNAPLPLMGAYRYVAIGLPVMLLSMFVLIAAALPAETLSVPRIVASQVALWNVVRQPLGLPLFMMLGLSLSLRGPFDYADAQDLAGGTSAEDAGARRLAWRTARSAMLVSVSVMAAAVFLGGHHGPWLPGPLWLLVKSVLILGALLVASHVFARLPPSRMLSMIWLVLLPLSFANLVLVGVEVLP